MERLTKREQLACHNVAYVSDDDCFGVWSVPKKFMGNAIDRLAAYEDTNLEPNEIRQFKTEIETIKEAVNALFEKQEFLKFLESKGYDITLGTKWMCKVFDILHGFGGLTMDAVKFINETIRMCNFYRGECSKCCSNKSCMFCNLNAEDAAKKAVAIVEQWSAEHPQKTMLQDFLEKFPNATLHDNGTPYCCPHDLGYKKRDKCSLVDCVYCWNRPVEEEDE